jgi:large subunit ribosomal protein L2
MNLSYQIPVWRGVPVSRLTLNTVSSSGRTNLGRVTVQHRGGGNSRKYRIVDFRRILREVPARIIRFERDPFRTAPIALLYYSNGVLSYILASKGLHDLCYIFSSMAAPIEPSNCLPLHYIPIGSSIHNIEPRRGVGGLLVRTGGSKAQILRKTKNFSIIRFASGELRYIHSSLSATIGVILTPTLFRTKLRKAGQSMWLNRRPTVRGVAANPIDHPHGGGEGKSSGGRPSVSPHGWLTKGYPTRKKAVVSHVLRTRRKTKELKLRMNV